MLLYICYTVCTFLQLDLAYVHVHSLSQNSIKRNHFPRYINIFVLQDDDAITSNERQFDESTNEI